jgi:hypothetical protein
MADYIPKPDAEAATYLENTANVLGDTPVPYGLTAAEGTALVNAAGAFRGALQDVDATKATLATMVATKDAKRATMEDLLRGAVQRIQVNPAVTDAMRGSAGIPLRDTTRSFNAPTPPLALQAMPDASGFNALKWEPGSNAAGARYVIEARIGAATEFATVDVVTATTYRHQGRTPGQPVIYRVLARRGEVLSQPSNTASVYQ